MGCLISWMIIVYSVKENLNKDSILSRNIMVDKLTSLLGKSCLFISFKEFKNLS